MIAETAQILHSINLQFYQTFAHPFSDTRQRLQPGVRKVLDTIPTSASLLDLGCGNGELAGALFRRGHQGIYLGVDASADLLALGEKRLERQPLCAFLQADLTEPGWDASVSSLALSALNQPGQFDIVTAFAVLHHIPGEMLRRQMLSAARSLLPPDGELIHSEWQFLSSARLRSRILPWQTVGLDDREVDPGDYLLDWRQAGYGLRYVHHFSEEELQFLAIQTGFSITQTFYSDGQSGRLSIYQRWRPI